MATNSEGRILAVDAAAAVGPFVSLGGLKFDATGRVVITTTNPIAVFLNGKPLDADGALCVTTS